MRYSIQVSILLLLPLSTLAIPYQRRAVTIPESVAGSSEARLGEAADREAASPPSTSATVDSEPEALAKTDAGKVLSDDVVALLVTGQNTLAQRIEEIWQSKDPEAAIKTQRLLDEQKEQADRSWAVGKFYLDQKANYLSYGENVFKKSQAAAEETPAHMTPEQRVAMQERLQHMAKIKDMEDDLKAEKERFLVAHKKANDRIDAVRQHMLEWVEKMSQERGTARPKDPSTS